MENNFIVTEVFKEEDSDFLNDILVGEWVENISNKDTNNRLFQEKTLLTENNLDDFFMLKMKDNFSFYSFCVPYSNTKINVSKMFAGDFFKIHNDSYMIGPYRTHIFLNEPDEYEGGEFCIFSEGKELAFKLKKGLALTYKTNTLSQIKPIINGEKIYASFFTKSLFRDDNIRDLYSKILYLNTKFENKPIVESYAEALDDPNFILNEIKDFLLYNYSEVRFD